jgi:ubiquinone/menaquinone biosynthesis C-methylase UbiE
MSLGSLYDSIANYYAEHDFFQIISSSMSAALSILQEADLVKDYHQVLDLGSGDGKFLSLIHDILPEAKMVAVDASMDMLKLVKEKIPQAQTVQANIDQAHKNLPHQQFDLAIASFVCAYVGLPELFDQTSRLLNQNGRFLLITSTREAFKAVQEKIEEIGKSKQFWNKIEYHWMKKTLEKTQVPKEFGEIKDLAKEKNFEILSRRRITIPLAFNDSGEALNFAENGGWAINLANYSWLPSGILKFLARKLLKHYSFPFRDQMIVEVILFKKLPYSR